MTNQEAIKMLTAKVECIRREASGIDVDCNFRNCDSCEFCYAQGTTGEQRKALNMAISALQAQEAKDSNESSLTQKGLDTISRQDAIDEIRKCRFVVDAIEKIIDLPSAQPEPSEITDEQAILHLQSTGWMQNHDREMYESGLREQLADDSGSYDSLIPCEDAISRTAAIEAVEKESQVDGAYGYMDTKNIVDLLNDLPSEQPETCEDTVSRNAIIQKLNTMDRYVSEELVLCDTDKKFPKNEVFIVDDVYEEIVENLPSAQPEIIHCKDCEHFGVDRYKKLTWCSRNGYGYQADDFCSKAERRTNGV